MVCVYSGRTEESWVVSTANYIARGYGVKSGIPIALAKRRLKGVDAVFLPVDHDLYKAVSDRIMAILRGPCGRLRAGRHRRGVPGGYRKGWDL